MKSGFQNLVIDESKECARVSDAFFLDEIRRIEIQDIVNEAFRQYDKENQSFGSTTKTILDECIDDQEAAFALYVFGGKMALNNLLDSAMNSVFGALESIFSTLDK